MSERARKFTALAEAIDMMIVVIILIAVASSFSIADVVVAPLVGLMVYYVALRAPGFFNVILKVCPRFHIREAFLRSVLALVLLIIVYRIFNNESSLILLLLPVFSVGMFASSKILALLLRSVVARSELKTYDCKICKAQDEA